jgi:hypothetical protein
MLAKPLRKRRRTQVLIAKYIADAKKLKAGRPARGKAASVTREYRK